MFIETNTRAIVCVSLFLFSCAVSNFANGTSFVSYVSSVRVCVFGLAVALKLTSEM